MASNGSGNRPSGNRSSGAKKGSGNRRATQVAQRPSANQRARERLEQQQGPRSGQGSGGRRPPAGRPRPGARRPPKRRRSGGATAGLYGGGLVVIVAVVIIIVSVLGGSGGGNDPYIKPIPIKANILSSLEHVPASELNAAGAGTAVVYPTGKKGSGAGLVSYPSGASFTSGGKPEIFFFGSEYCPYCAATRWPLTIALMHFGTFTGLKETASSPLDAYPSTHTLSFETAKYSSPYLDFKSEEYQSNECNPKDVERDPDASTPPYVCANDAYYVVHQPTKADIALITKYDSESWFPSKEGPGGIPFIDFGGKFYESGALYDPTLLSNVKWDQIVGSFREPTQGIGEAILAVSNRYTAIICKMTHDKPASVCSMPYVKAAAKALVPVK